VLIYLRHDWRTLSSIQTSRCNCFDFIGCRVNRSIYRLVFALMIEAHVFDIFSKILYVKSCTMNSVMCLHWWAILGFARPGVIIIYAPPVYPVDRASKKTILDFSHTLVWPLTLISQSNLESNPPCLPSPDLAAFLLLVPHLRSN